MRSTNLTSFPEVFKKRNFSISVNDALVDHSQLVEDQKRSTKVLNSRFAGRGYGTITLKPNQQVLNAPKDPGHVDFGKRT